MPEFSFYSYLCRVSTHISHTGIIESVSEGCVKVRILQTSACAACKVASHCHASELKEKIIDVFCSDSTDYEVGQNVTVWASRDVANRALLLGFGLPFLVLILALVLVLKLTGNEGLAAISALLSLMPYYLIVWLCRQKIQSKIAFHLK